MIQEGRRVINLWVIYIMNFRKNVDILKIRKELIGTLVVEQER